MLLRRLCGVGVAGLMAMGAVAALPAARSEASTPSVGHVVTIVLENTTWESVDSSTGRAAMPYLHALESQGVQLNRMYGVSHVSLSNYIAMTSGNPPNSKTKADCFSYDCVFESPHDANIGDQLESAGKTWKAYMESMPAPCAHGVEGAGEPYVVGYATRHNPFMYYRDVVSDQTRCASHDVPFAGAFASDVAGGNLANYSLVVPDTCNDGHDGGTNCGLAAADTWLATNVPQILASSQFQADGMLVITFDESAISDTRGCCGDSAGGHMYTLVLSPAIDAAKRGTDSAVPYSHYGLLRTVEDAFGLSCLGGACDAGSAALGADVFSPAADDFSVDVPRVSVKAGGSTNVTLATTITNGSAQSVSLSATNPAGATVTFSPSSISAGQRSVMSVSVPAGTAAQSTVIDVLASGTSVSHVAAVPLDVVSGHNLATQIVNGNFGQATAAGWTVSKKAPPTAVFDGASGAAARLAGTSSLTQKVAVASWASTLNFAVRIDCAPGSNAARVRVHDLTSGNWSDALAPTCVAGGTWQNVSVSATAWRGHSVVVSLESHHSKSSGAITVDYDEVVVR